MKDTAELVCRPRAVKSADTISLRMAVPHGDYLVVTRPDGTLFYLIYPRDSVARDSTLMPSDQFKNVPILRIRANVRGRPVFYARYSLEPIFSRPGNYQLKIASDFESEEVSDVRTCSIRFNGGN